MMTFFFTLCLCRAAYGLIERPNDFASYLLAIAICNLLLYFAFYIIMKVCALVLICCLDLHYICISEVRLCLCLVAER